MLRAMGGETKGTQTQWVFSSPGGLWQGLRDWRAMELRL